MNAMRGGRTSRSSVDLIAGVGVLWNRGLGVGDGDRGTGSESESDVQ